MKNTDTGVYRLFSATGYSLQGLSNAYRYESAFRLEVWLTILSVPLALYLGDNLIESIVLVMSLLFLLVVELLNTAVESVVDRIGEEFHELSGRAKDTASAAVLIASVIVALVWITVLLN